MGEYFARDYSGTPFELYGKGHMIALTIIILACFSLAFFRKLWGERERKYVRVFLAVLLVVDEISVHIWSAYWGTWTIQTMLPLHLCGVFVWLSAYMLLSRNQTVYELAYFLGIGGAMQALLTPDASQYGFPHYRAFQTFIAHGLIVLIPVYMTVVEGFRPTLQSFKRVFVWTNIYMVAVFFINLAINSNYLFIHHKPDFPTLLDILWPWPWYILQLEVIGLLIFCILYLPFLIKDIRTKKTMVAL